MGLALDESRDDDQVFDDAGLTYVVERELFDKVKPVKVDYVNTAFGSGFNITSSMAAPASCGSSCSC